MHGKILDLFTRHGIALGGGALPAPGAYMRRCVETMRQAGARVSLSTYPDVNHLPIFSHREKFLKELAEWLSNR